MGEIVATVERHMVPDGNFTNDKSLLGQLLSMMASRKKRGGVHQGSQPFLYMELFLALSLTRSVLSPTPDLGGPPGVLRRAQVDPRGPIDPGCEGNEGPGHLIPLPILTSQSSIGSADASPR